MSMSSDCASARYGVDDASAAISVSLERERERDF
jgi:hypothetical protein